MLADGFEITSFLCQAIWYQKNLKIPSDSPRLNVSIWDR